MPIKACDTEILFYFINGSFVEREYFLQTIFACMIDLVFANINFQEVTSHKKEKKYVSDINIIYITSI